METASRRALEEVLDALAQESPDGLLVVSADGRIVFMNRRFAEIWKLSAAAPTADGGELSLEAALERAVDPDRFLSGIRENAVGRLPTHDEVELWDGRVLHRYGAPLHTPAGTYLGWAWYFRDVTELKRAETEQRRLAATLQASLLPPRPPTVPGMDLATFFRPGDTTVDVGGDFFDVFRVGTNDWGLVVGDVCGKGAEAAALTALTRYTLRAATLHNFLPSAVLTDVNSGILADSPPDADDRFCAVVFARLELDTCGAWVTLSCAGHPRPVVVRKAGWIDTRGQIGTPLGMFDAPTVSDDRVGLGPGDALVICTDGVSEARDRGGDLFGEEVLPALLLEQAGAPVDDIVRRIVDAALDFGQGRAADDMAVLAIRVPEDANQDPIGRLSAATGVPPEQLNLPRYPVGEPPDELWRQRPAAPREARLRLPTEPASIPAARRFVSSVLRSWRMPELAEGDVELLTSELATNALRHAASPFTVMVRYTGAAIRVEVGDGSPELPTSRAPAADEPNGRGLMLIDTLSSGWGVTPTRDGKRVWFEIDVASTSDVAEGVPS